jgi:processive 1,2-diacylglycerol beta-glucosyltransferase
MGKNFRSLQSRARELKAAYPGRVKLLGWTRKVPQLLNKHHLVIGKAGGATVHEAIAARCPMLIHHLVPGQEEGNLQLLQQLGAGDLAENPKDLTQAVSSILANDAAKWRKMKTSLAEHNCNDGAITAARFILDKI